MSHPGLSHTARMSGEFDSRKDSQSTKFERRPRIFIKLSFRELCDSKWKLLESNFQPLFGLQSMFRKNHFLVICGFGSLDDLIQRGFWVISKITFANFGEPIHVIIIICFIWPSDTLNLETVERKGKNYKKLNIYRMKRSFQMK